MVMAPPLLTAQRQPDRKVITRSTLLLRTGLFPMRHKPLLSRSRMRRRCWRRLPSPAMLLPHLPLEPLGFLPSPLPAARRQLWSGTAHNLPGCHLSITPTARLLSVAHPTPAAISATAI